MLCMAASPQQHVPAGGGAPELPSARPQAPPFSERDPHQDHRNSSCAWEASNTTWQLLDSMCSRVGRTLAQGSENRDFILQNDTNKHSNNQVVFFSWTQFPQLSIKESSQLSTSIKRFHLCQWLSMWGRERKTPFLFTWNSPTHFQFSSLPNLLREDFQGSPKQIGSLLIPS